MAFNFFKTFLLPELAKGLWLTRIHEYHMENRGENIMSKDKLLAIGERYEAMIAADRAADARYR